MWEILVFSYFLVSYFLVSTSYFLVSQFPISQFPTSSILPIINNEIALAVFSCSGKMPSLVKLLKIINSFYYELPSISSYPAALIRFTELKTFSVSSKVKCLYSTFFSTRYRKSSNVLDVFYILLARFGPIFVKYLLNSSAMRLFKSLRVEFTFHVILIILK